MITRENAKRVIDFVDYCTHALRIVPIGAELKIHGVLARRERAHVQHIMHNVLLAVLEMAEIKSGAFPRRGSTAAAGHI